MLGRALMASLSETVTSATDPQGQKLRRRGNGAITTFLLSFWKRQLTAENFVSDERSGTTVARFNPLTLTTMRAPRLP